ncbi:MAG: hypothetical protein MOGMAGMI_00423 [Candidatus Omnitrophica bacterium]|nr:hypothetical protein [Candidatus Omnitrophota bacterium]
MWTVCAALLAGPAPADAESERAEAVEKRAGVFRPEQLRHVDTADVWRMILERDTRGQALQLVDLRIEADFAKGALPGAVNIPLKKMSFKAEAALNRTDPIVLYGYGSRDRSSINAAVLLAQKGYSNMSFYDDGYPGWVSNVVEGGSIPTGVDDAQT